VTGKYLDMTITQVATKRKGFDCYFIPFVSLLSLLYTSTQLTMIWLPNPSPNPDPVARCSASGYMADCRRNKIERSYQRHLWTQRRSINILSSPALLKIRPRQPTLEKERELLILQTPGPLFPPLPLGKTLCKNH